MAKALGTGWTRAGHQVRIGSRTPNRVTADQLGYTPVIIGDFVTALEGSSVVVLALPFSAVVPFVSAHRQQLMGKTIIDISNPFDALPHNEKAGAEYTADALGTSANLVAAFKDNFAATINIPAAADGLRPDVKMAGDDEHAKQVAASLAADLDHRVLDCGPLHNARLIDGMVALMLYLDRTYNNFTLRTGWRFTGLAET